MIRRGSQVALVLKNPPVHAGDIGDVSLIPGSGNKESDTPEAI